MLHLLDYAKRNDQAIKVLRLLKKELKKMKPSAAIKEYDLTLHNFENCRERGFTLRNGYGGKEVTWAESRGSDAIVIYPFVWGNPKAEEDYQKKSRYLKEGDYTGAVKIILNEIKNAVKEK